MGSVSSTPAESPVVICFYTIVGIGGTPEEICTLVYRSPADFQSESNMRCIHHALEARKMGRLNMISIGRNIDFVPNPAVAGVMIDLIGSESQHLKNVGTAYLNKLVLDFNFPYGLVEGGVQMLGARKVYQDAFTNSIVHLAIALNINIASVEAVWTHSDEPVDPDMVVYAAKLQDRLAELHASRKI